jgi:4-amino-4-deoxychorismate lyase
MLINGATQNTIDISDRGFQYGDGLFETIHIWQNQPLFLTQHLNRIHFGCQRLQIPEIDDTILRNDIKKSLLHLSSEHAVLKIIITRGKGGRGYRQPDQINPTRVLSLHPYPNYPIEYQTQGICARICETRLGSNPTLAGIKHLNRLEQILARAEWHDHSIQEGLMLDINDHVIEGTMTNFFYVKSGCLYTALIKNNGIAGIIRDWIMRIATQFTLNVVEQPLTLDNVYTADELLLCNSIIGIWGIRQLEDRHYSIGPITKQLQQALNFEKQKQVSYALS